MSKTFQYEWKNKTAFQSDTWKKDTIDGNSLHQVIAKLLDKYYGKVPIPGCNFGGCTDKSDIIVDFDSIKEIRKEEKCQTL